MNNEKLTHLSKPPFLSGQDIEQKRGELQRYFIETWELYESLFNLINDDKAYYLRPEPLRHPLIFYYGHTATFFINKLILGKYIQKRIDPHLESICAVGVDEMSWDDLKPDNYQWPSVSAVREYRSKVKTLILQLIDETPFTLPITSDSFAWLILMGIEHERIHIETSSVIMRMLDLKYLTPSDKWRSCNESHSAPVNQLIPVQGKTVCLGKAESNDTYGWDNEYGFESVTVDSFKASQYLVSNDEFMAFVEAGGYQETKWWTEEGQKWLDYTQAKMPRFWLYRNGAYWQRNLLNEQPLPADWPVEVNYLEAKAFCNWLASKNETHIRLPTEAEWQVMRDTLDTDLPYWEQAPGNINMEHYASSCPVNQFAQGEFYDIIGNVWQWTESPIDAYDGFQVHPLYDDFSTPTFDGLHNLIKGGSWISMGNEAMRDSRYAFRRHFFQHAGFRYVESDSADVPVKPVNRFETQPEISQMLHHHYGSSSNSASIPSNDLQQLAQLAIRSCENHGKGLDLGCGTGRMSYELARQFAHVDGIDFTARHIQHALHFKERGLLRYALPEEGELQSFHEVDLHKLGLAELAPKVNFVQGDAHNLKPQFDGYDLIVCHQLLEFLYNPIICLKNITSRINNNGTLIISSAYQWQPEYSESSRWLGGKKRDGENLTTFEGLREVLSSKFELMDTTEIDTQLRMNARSFQTTRNQVSIWKKHSN